MIAAQPAKIWVFFYGSYMNRSVLNEVNLQPECMWPARVAGFDIQIAPRANLVPTDGGIVYGALSRATHAELERLYTHAAQVLGERYLPQAILAEASEGGWYPALCYIAPEMRPRPAARDYVLRIVEPARELGFPAWYVARLEGFYALSVATAHSPRAHCGPSAEHPDGPARRAEAHELPPREASAWKIGSGHYTAVAAARSAACSKAGCAARA